VLQGLQSAASHALGLQTAFVGYWNEQENCLEYPTSALSAAQLDTLGPGLSMDGGLLRAAPDGLVARRCFSPQQPQYSEDVLNLDLEHAALYRLLQV